MTVIGCELRVAGTRFADTAAAYEAAEPVALADLEVAWGRATTVDQPEAGSCRFNVQDRSGGSSLIDVLPVGATCEVWASGDISTGAPVETTEDGGFEQMPPGDPGNRVAHASTSRTVTQTIVTTPTHQGQRALGLHVSGDDSVGVRWYVPPSAFQPANPAAWDHIPRFTDGLVWSWGVAVRGGYHVHFRTQAATLTSPTALGTPTLVGADTNWTGDLAWHSMSATTPPAAGTGDVWLAVSVAVYGDPAWTTATETWQTAPGAWSDWSGVTVDDVSTTAPADQLMRDVLVFSGRITDLTVQLDHQLGGMRAEVTAIDQLADLENRYVGDVPWLAETLASRVGRILSAAGMPSNMCLIDAPLGALQVSWRDVDSQPTGGLIRELAAGVDGVCWSATHATRGPFLWIENPASRAGLGLFVEGEDGVVRIEVDVGNRAPGRTDLDGCEVIDTETTWRRDVTDVITRVDATWLEQTVDTDTGAPAPTERHVQLVDTTAEASYGARRMGVSTPLTSASDCTDVANRVMARTRLQWRAEGLVYDLGVFPPADVSETNGALDLLDGTTRLGRGIVVAPIDDWPAAQAAGMYLDGGRYRYDGDWSLGLVTTPMAGMGQTGGWATMDPTWAWSDMDPTVGWIDCWGVTGPIGTTWEAV